MPANIHAFSAAEYPEKHETRTDTLNLLRDENYPTSLFYDGHLTRDWMELCGDKPDETCALLLQEGVLKQGHGKYIGINREQSIIDSNAAHYAGDAGRTRWICGNTAHLLMETDDPRFRDVGVFVFDAFNSVTNLDLEQILYPILHFAKTQYERHGQFLLVVNLSLRGCGGRPLREAKAQFNQIIQKHCGISVPQSAFITYRSKIVVMRLLRLSYGW